jgi:hypothetical protein
LHQAVFPEHLHIFHISFCVAFLDAVCAYSFFVYLIFNLTRIMDLEKVPTSHKPSTPPQRVQRSKAEAEAGAGANVTGTSAKNVVLDKEDSDHDQESIATTAVDEPVGAVQPDGETPNDDSTRPETPPEAKRSKGRTALIMSALCVWTSLEQHKKPILTL